MSKIDGRYLKDLRIKNGYSLREFAKVLYTSKSSLQRWESSYLPENEEVLARIAEVCNVSVEQIKNFSSVKQKHVCTKEEQKRLQMFSGLVWLPVVCGLFALFVLVAFLF